jgi:hypothetical protein
MKRFFEQNDVIYPDRTPAVYDDVKRYPIGFLARLKKKRRL